MMDLRRYGHAIRKSWWILLICLLMGIAAASVFFWRTPSTYAATVEFYVSTPVDDGSNPQAAATFAQQRVNSYMDVLTSEKLASRVVAETGLDASVEEVRGSISANSQVGNVTITTTVKSSSPEKALTIAQGIDKTFKPLIDELDNVGKNKDGTTKSVVDIVTVSAPTASGNPVSPDLRLFLVAGGGGGLLLGLIVALGRELFDTSVRDVEDLRTIVEAPLLGSVPNDPLVKEGPLIGSSTASPQAESFRKIRTNLQFVGAARQADVVLITSSLPQEGKSICASNLAMSMAELNQSVLLIDADLRRPRQAEYFDIANGAGLSNVLAGQIDVGDAIQPWGDSGLYILPSGVTPPNPAELLGSAAMGELLEDLRTRYEHIIIDSPPVIPVTDATVLCGFVDGVVLVTRLGKTSRSALQETVRVLRTLDSSPLGIVSNESSRARASRTPNVTYYAKEEQNTTWVK